MLDALQIVLFRQNSLLRLLDGAAQFFTLGGGPRHVLFGQSHGLAVLVECLLGGGQLGHQLAQFALEGQRAGAALAAAADGVPAVADSRGQQEVQLGIAHSQALGVVLALDQIAAAQLGQQERRRGREAVGKPDVVGQAASNAGLRTQHGIFARDRLIGVNQERRVALQIGQQEVHALARFVPVV